MGAELGPAGFNGSQCCQSANVFHAGTVGADADLTPKELDNLVAPIALYPDALVAQILAAATYPDQITAANDWLRANSSLKDQALMQAADKQHWDPSVKA
jgi:hypothetical protein